MHLLSPDLTPAPRLPPSAATCGTSGARSYPVDHINRRFGNRLRALRKEQNFTQLRMAIDFGVDRSFISDLECGHKGVSLPILEVFALGLNLSLSDLLDGL